MLTLVAATAALLGLIVVVALAVILIFVTQIRPLVAETSAILEVVGERAGRLAERVERMRRATQAAASELAATET